MKKTDSATSLLGAFPKPSYDDWRKAAEEALKGAPFDKKMLSPTPEGITLQPIYNERPSQETAASPGVAPFARGTHAAGYLAEHWQTAQILPVCLAESFNKLALEDLNRGQNALHIPLAGSVQSGDAACKGPCSHGKALSAKYAADFETALRAIDLKIVPVYLHAGANAAGVAATLYAALENLGIAPADLNGSLGADPIGFLAKTGALSTSAEAAMASAVKLAAYNAKHAPRFAAIAVDTFPYALAGASAVEELAVAVATGVAYLRACVEAGMSADDAARQVMFALSIGPKFFMEIGKFRASRIVWARAAEAFGASSEAAKLRVCARTGLYNKTLHDPYVNMLRTTTEAFSAVVGGVDALTIGAFDEIVRPADEFSRRIARNQSLILSEECDLRNVIDPAGGSYYVETITAELATRAWALFQEIEKQGGILAALESGFVQGKIAKTAAERLKKFNQRRENLVGTNLYPNLAEKPLAKPACEQGELYKTREAQLKSFAAAADKPAIEKALAKADVGSWIQAAKAGASTYEIFAASKSGEAATITALPQVRMAAAYESLRAAAAAFKEKTLKAPSLFLATMGPLREHKARADFTRGFFQAGGFDIIYPKGFDSNEAAVKAAVESGASAVVICSTDDNYPTLVPALTQALKAAKPSLRVILAGAPAPEHAEAYTAAGLDDAISIRSNHYDTLKNLLTFMGVLA